jgi:hypothetical protein
MGQGSNIRVFLNRFDYGKSAYFTFAFPCGFCCGNAVFEKGGAPKAVNQAFPEIFANYISLYADRECQKKLPFKIFRNEILFLSTSSLEAFSENMEKIHFILFYMEPSEEIFNFAKASAISSMKKRYAEIRYRALYKMLEFSESEKRFRFSKLARDMQELDFAEFSRYQTCFIQPENCTLLAAGNFENIPSELRLKKREKTCEVPRFCFFNREINFGNDFHVVQPDILDYSAGCMKFFFKGKDVSATERYFLLSLLAAVLFQEDYDVHVDAADASIIYWNRMVSEYKYRLADALSDPKICDVSGGILHALYSMQTKQPENFLALWSSLMMNGINLQEYIHLLEACSCEGALRLFKKSDPIVCEGGVFLRAGDTDEPNHH